MQTIIGKLPELVTGNVGLMLGLALVGVVTLQGLLMLYSSLRCLALEGLQRRLTRERTQREVDRARMRLGEMQSGSPMWNGWRKFRVAKKIRECEGVCSFYLEPHDGRKPLPTFQPGQFITFQLNIPGQLKPVIRCYSLSDCAKPDYYRVTIKKALPPPEVESARPGLASSYFCDQVREGDILDVRAPAGHFCVDVDKSMPVVLVGGGVGVTPMLSMANAIVEYSARTGSKREVWFFFGGRSRADHIQKEAMERLAAENRSIRLNVCYSRPGSEDQLGRDYHHKGRISVHLFKQLLPCNNYQFYLCGPDSFMKDLKAGLENWGVPETDVHIESFGPPAKRDGGPPPDTTVSVEFSRSGKICTWTPADGSLLDFAEANGVTINSGCRAGSCSTCSVAIKKGEVEYTTQTEALPEGGSCLTCVCRPKTALVLDA